MTDPLLPQQIIRSQLAVLEAYERALADFPWDEAKLNEALKTAMVSLLPLLRAQRVLGEQMFAMHKELINQYRRALEAALEQYGDTPP
jgi:hypothetical protein